MLTYNANTGLIIQRAQAICKALHDNLADAEAFYQWLSAQADSDFTSLPNPISADDLAILRSAFADLHALNILAYGQPAPSTYGITGTYDFSNTIKEVAGP